MRKPTLLVLPLVLAFTLLTSATPARSDVGTSAPDLSSFTAALLHADDLLPLCDWQAGPVYLRPAQLGILAYSSFSCGTDPNLRRVDQMLLYTPKMLQFGDGVPILTPWEDKYQEPVSVGSWARSLATFSDYHAVNFTKANTWAYIGPNMGYYDHWPQDFQTIIDLANIVEARLPETFTSLTLPRYDLNQTPQTPEEGFYLEVPSLKFHDTDIYGLGNTLVVTKEHTGQLSYRVFYAEPHDTVMAIYNMDEGGRMVHAWQMPAQQQIAVSLLESEQDWVVREMDLLPQFFFTEGRYTFRQWVDGVLVLEQGFQVVNY